MKTVKEGVVTIHHDDQLYGLIHRDPKTGHKILYRCEPMDEDEIVEIIECKTDEKVR